MSNRAALISRIVVSSLAGALLGLLVGLIAMALAPDDGLGDLAAATVTKVLLVPAGLMVGAASGWWSRRKAGEGAP